MWVSEFPRNLWIMMCDIDVTLWVNAAYSNHQEVKLMCWREAGGDHSSISCNQHKLLHQWHIIALYLRRAWCVLIIVGQMKAMVIYVTKGHIGLPKRVLAFYEHWPWNSIACTFIVSCLSTIKCNLVVVIVLKVYSLLLHAEIILGTKNAQYHYCHYSYIVSSILGTKLSWFQG